MFTKRKLRKNIWLHVVLFVILISFCFVNRDYFHLMPFTNSYRFEGPSNIFFGEQNNTYVIDNGKKTIIILDENKKYANELIGGSLDKEFYYASQICDDAEGNIYIVDVVYSGVGTRIERERILKYDKQGRYLGTLFEKVYEESEAPYQYGNIFYLQNRGTELEFGLHNGNSIEQYFMNFDGTVSDPRSWNADLEISDLAYDFTSDRMIITTRQGNVVGLEKDGTEEVLWDGEGTKIPWMVAVDDAGSIYFSELTNYAIYKLDAETCNTIATSDSCYYTVEVNRNQDVITTDYSGICYVDSESENYIAEVGIKNHMLRILTWLAAVATGVYVFTGLILLIRQIVRRTVNKEQLVRIVMVLSGSILCTAVVSVFMLRSMAENQDDIMLQRLDLFADLMMQELDIEGLISLERIDEYQSESYCQIREPLDKMVDTAYENGSYYYYTIYVRDGKYINAVLDYERTLTTKHPTYEWGDNVYTQVLQSGERVQMPRENSAYGTWTFVLHPIRNAQGENIGLLEIGTNVDDVKREQRSLQREILFTAIISAIVIIMILLEVLFLFSNWSAAKADIDSPTTYVPLRTIIFMIYLSSCLQDPFVVQLCKRLYDGALPISDSIASSLPISAGVFMAAVASFVAGRLIARTGTKKTMIAAAIFSVIGFVLCSVGGQYYTLLIGKALIGMGMGAVYVTSNTLATLGRTEEERRKAFADINVGVLSGVTVGDGFGSVLLTFGNYQMVYIVGAFIMVLALVILIQCRSLKPEPKKTGGSIRFAKFMFNWRVLPYFLLILLPFMIMVAYRDYFFPLYAEEHGMSEVTIGRVLLLCGLVIIYVGPILAEWMLRKLGSQKAMFVSSLLVFVVILVYICVPGMTSMLVGVVGMSIIVSFAYTCQYAYFSSVPECDRYGEGNAMSVYTMIENGGQTLGPIVFGAILVFGNVQGVRYIGYFFGAMLALYLVVMLIQKRTEKRG